MQKKRNIISLVETYNEVDTEKYIKSYMFIKGFAVAKNLKQTLIIVVQLSRQKSKHFIMN